MQKSYTSTYVTWLITWLFARNRLFGQPRQTG